MKFLSFAVLTMAGSRPLETRLCAVLDKNVTRTSPSVRAVRAAMLIAVVLCGIVGTARLTAQTPAAPPAATEPNPEQQKARADMDETLKRAKQVAISTMMYVQDYDEVFPPANQYPKLLKPYIIPMYRKGMETNAFTSALDTLRTISFKLNPAVAGKNISRLEFPANTVLFYEGTLEKPLFRYGWGSEKRAVIGFADGHVKMVTPKQMESIQWTLRILKRPLPSSAPAKKPTATAEVILQEQKLRQAVAVAHVALAEASRARAEVDAQWLKQHPSGQKRTKAEVLALALATVQTQLAQIRNKRVQLDEKARALNIQVETLRRMQTKP